MRTRLVSGCKINLFLHVGERLPSGYHALETLFVPLSQPCDILEIETRPIQPQNKTKVKAETKTGTCEVFCQNKAVDPVHNTLTKAYEAYTLLRPLTTSLTIHLTKQVPIGGGLGGGSANAAALLTYMQSLEARQNIPPLSAEVLAELGKSIGADVPFFLTKGCQRALGIGEKLTPCENPFAGYFLLLVCPQISVSTGWAFAELSAMREKQEQNLRNTLTCSPHQDSNTSSQTGSFRNDFEEVVYKAHPELKRIKNILLEQGAEMALLSGTGASVFGIFKKEDFAQKVLDKILHTVYLVKL